MRGRAALAAARAGIFALLLLLLLNPSIPGRTLDEADGEAIVLLDASLSMLAIDTSGASAWSRAMERVRALEVEEAGAVRVVHFGRGFERADAAAAEGPDVSRGAGTAEAADAGARGPRFVRSELAPALERAAELGTRRVIVVSDMRVHDAVAAREVLDRLGVAVRFERVGGALRNAGIAEFTLPSGVEAGDSVPAEVVLFAESPGAEADSALLEIRDGERLAGSLRVGLEGMGRTVRVSLSLPPPGRSGLVEYRATVRLEGDGFPLDDERFAHVTVDPDEGGVVLVSWRPDWEPRFLLPILEQVTGLPGHGYLRTGEGSYLRMGGGPGAGGAVEEEALRRRVARADLLVVHGVDAAAPPWLLEGAASAYRLLAFARDRQGAAAVGVSAGNPVTGEWYADADLPPSPLAAALSGTELSSLPPLTRLLPHDGDADGSAAPLRLQLQGRGAVEPALLLRSEGRRRQAVVLASGFWRWGFREGAPRQTYRRLWAAVGGWLLGNEPLADGPGVRPESSILPRGVEVGWGARGFEGEALAVRVLREDSVAVDTLVTAGEDGRFRTPALPPGRYAYEVRGQGEDGAPPDFEASPVAGEGVFLVEAHSGELALLPRDLARSPVAQADPDGPGAAGAGGELPAGDPGTAAERDTAGEPTAGEAGDGPRLDERGRRPLRTHPLPFILLLGLLCGEWIGRRRKGLR